MLNRRLIKSFSWTLLAFIFASINLVFLFDDSYDGLLSNTSIGQFSDFSFFDWHFLGVIWIKVILKYIQNQCFNIDVFYTFYLICVLISSVYLFYTFEKIASNSNFILKTIIQIAFLILIVDSLIFITHTRFATLFTGLALLNLGLFHPRIKSKTFIHVSFFIFGFLIRPESGVGSIILIIPGLFLYGISTKRVFLVSLIPLISSAIFFITLNVYKQYTDRLEILIEPDVEYAMSTDKFVAPPKNASEFDSVRYVFARNAFFIDTSFVDDEYLRSIISSRTDFDLSGLQKSVKHISHFYASYSILFFALILILFMIWFNRQKWLFYKAVVYNFGIFIILVLLDYQINVADRHFSPLMILTILISFLFVKKRISNFSQNVIEIFSFAIFMFPARQTWEYIYQNNLFVETKMIENNKSLNLFEERIHGKNVFVTVSGFKLFDKPYTFFVTKRSKNSYYIYDMSTYSIVPRYADYLSRHCNCNATIPIEIFKWISKTNGIIIIDEKRANLLKAYFKVKNNVKLVFYDAIDATKILHKSTWPDLKFKRIRFIDSLSID